MKGHAVYRNERYETQSPIFFGTFRLTEVLGDVTSPVHLPIEVSRFYKYENRIEETETVERPESTARRVAYIERTTEEGAFQTAPLTEEEMSLSEMESSTPSSPAPLDATPQMERLRLANSLHGLSLTRNMADSEAKLLKEKTEILARKKPVDIEDSPAASTTSTVTYISTSGTSQGGGEGNPPKPQTKSAKKRLRQKKKQQLHQAQASHGGGPSCLKIPCVQATNNRSPSIDKKQCLAATSSPHNNDCFQDHLALLLSDHLPTNVSLRFYEQGIRNLGSTCFLGSAIQFLLGCPYFCWLIYELGAIRMHLDAKIYPVISSLGSLAQHLQVKKSAKHKAEYRTGYLSVIHPDMLTPIVERFRSRSHQEHLVRDQDVQEFLIFMLDSMQHELSLLRQNHRHFERRKEDPSTQNMDDDSWTFVGKKNKVSNQRVTGKQENSILSCVFGGLVQSEVKAQKMVPSVTADPFIILMLDIVPGHITSIEDALDHYTSKVSLPDYQVSGSQRACIATKVNLFKKLPRALILCLKQYTYAHDGIKKTEKHISFGWTLDFKRKWMASGEPPAQYELLATCNHHGLGRGGDHYTADVWQGGEDWLYFNDSTYDRIPSREVLASTPYLLLYGRI